MTPLAPCAHAHPLRARVWSRLVLAVALCLLPRTALASGLTDETYFRIIVLLAAVSVGYGVTHFTMQRLARRYSFAGGVEYVALGLVLGPVLGVLDDDLARDIRPVLLLGAGALGMLAGLDLGERQQGREIRGAWAAALLITSFTALTVILLPLGVAWIAGYDIQAERAWTGALLFVGVVALGSDAGPIRHLAALLGAKGAAPGMGIAVAHRVRALATLGFGVLFALINDAEALELRPALGTLEALGIQVGAGVVLGLLFGVVVYRRLDQRTLLAVVVGMVFLTGGFAFALDMSAIFVCFVAGLTFALSSPHAAAATRAMRTIKEPFVIALYFFAGLEWIGGQVWVFAMIVPFLALRWLGRRLGGGLGARLVKSPANLGPATTAPGGLTLAFLVSIGVVYRNTPGIADAYGPMVTALVILELVSLRAVRRWLVDVAGVTSESGVERSE